MMQRHFKTRDTNLKDMRTFLLYLYLELRCSEFQEEGMFCVKLLHWFVSINKFNSSDMNKCTRQPYFCGHVTVVWFVQKPVAYLEMNIGKRTLSRTAFFPCVFEKCSLLIECMTHRGAWCVWVAGFPWDMGVPPEYRLCIACFTNDDDDDDDTNQMHSEPCHGGILDWTGSIPLLNRGLLESRWRTNFQSNVF